MKLVTVFSFLSILLCSPIPAAATQTEAVANLYQSIGSTCIRDAEPREVCSCRFVQELAKLTREESLPEFDWRAAVELTTPGVVGGPWSFRTQVQSKYGAIMLVIHYGNSVEPCLASNDPKGYVAALRTAILAMKEVDRAIEDMLGLHPEQQEI